ncbi:unnamed protein product [Spirodela intermedia]|uniref:RING-type E3 ubiquitin transferase n=1 Tax=Spirodela intermedia TaxID=51605 RepID=A0A7I8KVA2_SPIIN|nr:unnamed protein product [Spirodela intermedia]
MDLYPRIVKESTTISICLFCFAPGSPPALSPEATDYVAPPSSSSKSTLVRLPGNSHLRSIVTAVVGAGLAVCFLLIAIHVVLRHFSRRRRGGVGATAAPPHQAPAPAEGGVGLRQDLLVGIGGEEPYHVWYIKTVGLDEMTIEAISVFPYKKGEGLVDGSDCAVCLGEFQEGEMLRLLPKCSHAFHIPCIDTWLRSHVNCPLCRAPIVAPPQNPTPPILDPGTGSRSLTAAAVDQGGLEAGGRADSRESGMTLSQTASDERSAEVQPSAVLPPAPRGDSFSSEESESEICVAIDLGNGGIIDAAPPCAVSKEGSGDLELQPVRRSVSMDSALASLLLRMRLAGSRR